MSSNSYYSMRVPKLIMLYSVNEIQHLMHNAIKYDLEGTDVFDRFSLDDMCRIYNGVGPDRFPEWFRDLVTKLNHTPLPAVLIHDLEFEIGGSVEKFHEVNLRLFHNLRKITLLKYSKWNPMYYIQWIRSWYFYKICEDIGFEGWPIS